MCSEIVLISPATATRIGINAIIQDFFNETKSDQLSTLSCVSLHGRINSIAKVRRAKHFQKKQYNKKILFLTLISNYSVMTQKSTHNAYFCHIFCD